MWCFLGVLGLAAIAISAFQPAAAQSPDVSKELLTEVRALRIAMEQLASAGPRVQLMFGRLQLQEQRINEQLRKADAVRAQVAKAQDEESQLRAQISRHEEFLRNNPGSPERAELEQEIPRLRRHLAALAAEVQKFQVEEANLSSQISIEQNRWNDINRALDELDRTLTRR